ncbi:uncharacterized protein LOC134257058, partial [Saccostrea cucullata]|uniref:uncharacterized protein LOC134257058 n=1 Tax=Saccostrea cuccullata TaxID=36930 RepID=UPI002ED6168B
MYRYLKTKKGDGGEKEKMDFFGCKTDLYPNALSMYLMKKGKWKIPKNIIKTSFNQKSIEYIFEKEMSSDFQEGLWKDLELKTRYAYTAPKWKGYSKDKGDGKLNVNTSGLFGLIFFALLKRRCYEGAKQLIETGC